MEHDGLGDVGRAHNGLGGGPLEGQGEPGPEPVGGAGYNPAWSNTLGTETGPLWRVIYVQVCLGMREET